MFEQLRTSLFGRKKKLRRLPTSQPERDELTRLLAQVRKANDIKAVQEVLVIYRSGASLTQEESQSLDHLCRLLDRFWYTLSAMLMTGITCIISKVNQEQVHRQIKSINETSHAISTSTSRIVARELPEYVPEYTARFFYSKFMKDGDLVDILDARKLPSHDVEFLQTLVAANLVTIDGSYVHLTDKGREFLLANRLKFTQLVPRLARWLRLNSVSGMQTLLGWLGSGLIGVALTWLISGGP